jgi:hypothetical protein
VIHVVTYVFYLFLEVLFYCIVPSGTFDSVSFHPLITAVRYSNEDSTGAALSCAFPGIPVLYRVGARILSPGKTVVVQFLY